MENNDGEGISKDSSNVGIVICLASEVNPRGSDWHIRDLVQYRVRTKLFRSTNAFVLASLSKVAVPLKEGLV